MISNLSTVILILLFSSLTLKILLQPVMSLFYSYLHIEMWKLLNWKWI